VNKSVSKNKRICAILAFLESERMSNGHCSFEWANITQRTSSKLNVNVFLANDISIQIKKHFRVEM
jgi:hypothetical protein